MSSKFDLLRDVSMSNDEKVWKIRVRVVRLWKVPIFNDKNLKPMIDMVVMDEERNRIQCTIRTQHVKLFEEHLIEGMVYAISNVQIAFNTVKYKPANHEFRIFFKKDTQVRASDDHAIPTNVFQFVPNSLILSEANQDSHLVDVIGLLTAKGDPQDYSKKDKNSKRIVIELDDLQSNDKIRCTLWEDFAIQFVDYLQDHPGLEYIIILQLGKFNFYQGSMGVSNANYASKLLINANLPEVAEFQLRVRQSNDGIPLQLSQLDGQTPYSIEDDFLNQCLYKTISNLKEPVEEKSIFVTIGTVKSIENESNWWYKGCKKCSQGLKEMIDTFYCKKCDANSTAFMPRYSIRLRVVDDTTSTLFVLYDREACKFLNISASDLRSDYFTRGGEKTHYPVELDSFKDKRFLFKVSVRLEEINSIQPNAITIIKLCTDEKIVSDFISKYNIGDLTYLAGSSDVFSGLPDISALPDVSDLNKECCSQSFQNLSDLHSDPLVTPSKSFSNDSWIATPNTISPHDEGDGSSTKLRKVIKTESLD